MSKPSRNLGIDLLRIISMFGVVILHLLGHGGILASDLSPLNYSLVWFLETLAYPAVNCFILISGYVGYRGEQIYPKLKGIFSLFFTVLFYSLTIYVLLAIFGIAPIGIKELAKNCLPILSKRYWFFTNYFGMFLLSPFLNYLVSRFTKKQTFLFFLAFFLLCCISLVRDTFYFSNGFSLVWFLFLYFIGGLLKKYEIAKLFRKRIWLLIILFSFACMFLPMILFKFIDIPIISSRAGMLINYISPPMALMAIAVVCLFSKFNCSPAAAAPISFFATSAFSVYLIHENQYIRANFITQISQITSQFHQAFLILFIICCATVIFLSCILVDKVRIALFALLKVDQLAALLDRLFHKKINQLFDAVNKTIDK